MGKRKGEKETGLNESAKYGRAGRCLRAGVCVNVWKQKRKTECQMCKA